MEVSDQLMSRERGFGIHWIRGRVGPKDTENMMEKKKPLLLDLGSFTS
jgi:hypothetical protein